MDSEKQSLMPPPPAYTPLPQAPQEPPQYMPATAQPAAPYAQQPYVQQQGYPQQGYTQQQQRQVTPGFQVLKTI